jgi:hypothetical protein
MEICRSIFLFWIWNLHFPFGYFFLEPWLSLVWDVQTKFFALKSEELPQILCFDILTVLSNIEIPRQNFLFQNLDYFSKKWDIKMKTRFNILNSWRFFDSLIIFLCSEVFTVSQTEPKILEFDHFTIGIWISRQDFLFWNLDYLLNIERLKQIIFVPEF